MTEQQYQRIKSKVEREYPARKRLASLAGLKRLDDETISELFLRIQILDPLYEAEARSIIASTFSESS